MPPSELQPLKSHPNTCPILPRFLLLLLLLPLPLTGMYINSLRRNNCMRFAKRDTTEHRVDTIFKGYICFRLKILTASFGLRKMEENTLSHLPPASSSIFGDLEGLLDSIPWSPPQRRPRKRPGALHKNELFGFRYPVLAEKTEWWWRTLACVPYLIALQISDTGYFIQPFLERHDFIRDLIYFVPGAITRSPAWLIMIYCYFAYIGTVKNKDFPHFFRFHLMMGMLLETALQILSCTSNFFLLIHYNGRFGMYFWAGVGFSYITILLQGVRFALAGDYAHLSFVSDAAYVHTLFNIGGYHRPF